jgi:hypothetical protein
VDCQAVEERADRCDAEDQNDQGEYETGGTRVIVGSKIQGDWYER